MKAKVYLQDGTVKSEMDLPDSVFAGEIRDHLMYQVVKSYLQNQRQGTSKTKRRGEVSGGGKKPWKQKGTGRARAGSNTSPIWVRGGKAHGPEPRDYVTRIPKKMRKAALISALSSRAKDEKIMVVDSVICDEPKTKIIEKMLGAMAINGRKNLLVVEGGSKNIYLSGRNLKNLDIKPILEINALDVLNNENIIFGNEKLVGKMEEVVAS